MQKALICDYERLSKLDVGILVWSLFFVFEILVNDLLMLIEGSRSDKGLAAHVAGDGILMVLEVGLECGTVVETLVTLVTRYLLSITYILMDFKVGH